MNKHIVHNRLERRFSKLALFLLLFTFYFYLPLSRHPALLLHAVRFRGNAKAAAEQPAERAQALEADRKADVGNGRVGCS
jgi:hypothetical protein